MPPVTYVRGAEKMLTAARLSADGLYVRFADDRDGVIPLSDLAIPGTPHHVVIPRPHVIEVRLEDGGVEEVPWDFARHYAESGYRERAEAEADRARGVLGWRLRALRSERGITQHTLADRSGVGRVTIARIEAGEQLPRYRTLVALAEGLGLQVERLVVGPDID